MYFRRTLSEESLHPEICFDDAGLNVVEVLVDHLMFGSEARRWAIVDFAKHVAKLRDNTKSDFQAILLPAALHESFYRTGALYEGSNPIRLLDMDQDGMEATLRRAATEAIARALHADNAGKSRPLKVFLSHAKRDGIPMAECIRDSVRRFGQLEAWYDSNDLPFGAASNSPMKEAAKTDTAAMIAAVTDAYPTRPWCRKEAKLARTPVKVKRPDKLQVWKVHQWLRYTSPGLVGFEASRCWTECHA